jgi:hypothetical protein
MQSERLFNAKGLTQVNQRVNGIQRDCEAVLQTVMSLCGDDDWLTARAVQVCNELKRLRAALNQSVRSGSIHRIK